MNFHDTEVAFASKTNAELHKKYWLFKLMNSGSLVDFGTSLTKSALSWHLPINFAIKATIFKHFCGGETIEECEDAIQDMAKSNVGTILDYSVEGKFQEEDFEATKLETIRTIERANGNKKLPFSVFKVSGVAPLGTLEKVSAKLELSTKTQSKWTRINARINDICERGFELNQPIFIDAEESWIQPAIDELATEMMAKFNREKPLIYNTIQLYRHDRLQFLKCAHADAKRNGYVLAVKLVRGAYMEKERLRAEENGYESPIQPDKESTDRDYNLALKYCLENINEIAFVAGSHNEQSVQFLTQMLCENGIANNHPHVCFSQLFGMSDNLSYVLAKENYNVSKYLPYGPVRDAVPYLIRRAKENTSVMGQMSRELELISEELERRKLK